MLSDIRPGTHLLRVQVYDYLQEQMRSGMLQPGDSISVNTMIEELGVSRTPLREALLLLQEQGFVTIQPQRGVKINVLTLEDVKDIYEILGGIESTVIFSVFDKLGKTEINRMIKINKTIKSALKIDNIIQHNQANIQFHDVFLLLSENHRLLKYVKTLKMQLYDFPKRDYGKQWNLKNYQEHERIIELISAGNPLETSNYLRDVHWKFKTPDSFSTISDNISL